MTQDDSRGMAYSLERQLRLRSALPTNRIIVVDPQTLIYTYKVFQKSRTGPIIQFFFAETMSCAGCD